MLVAGGTTLVAMLRYFPIPRHPRTQINTTGIKMLAIPKPLSFHIIYLFSFTVKEYVNKRYSAVFGKPKSIEYDDILGNTCCSLNFEMYFN